MRIRLLPVTTASWPPGFPKREKGMGSKMPNLRKMQRVYENPEAEPEGCEQQRSRDCRRWQQFRSPSLSAGDLRSKLLLMLGDGTDVFLDVIGDLRQIALLGVFALKGWMPAGGHEADGLLDEGTARGCISGAEMRLEASSQVSFSARSWTAQAESVGNGRLSISRGGSRFAGVCGCGTTWRCRESATVRRRGST